MLHVPFGRAEVAFVLASALALGVPGALQAEPWARIVDGPGSDRFTAVAPAHDGSLLAVGTTTRRGAGGMDGWLVAFDSLGNVRWEAAVGTPADDVVEASADDSGGAIVLVGPYGGPSIVARLRSDGSLAWALQPSASRVSQAIALAGGGALLAGSRLLGHGADGQAMYYGWMAALDETGALVWQRRCDADNVSTSLWHAAPAPDGGAYVAGMATHADDPAARRWYRSILFRVDGSGSVVWARAIGQEAAGGSGPGPLVPTADGGVLVGVNRSSTVGHSQGTLMTVDPDGVVSSHLQTESGMTCVQSYSPYGMTLSGDIISRVSLDTWGCGESAPAGQVIDVSGYDVQWSLVPSSGGIEGLAGLASGDLALAGVRQGTASSAGWVVVLGPDGDLGGAPCADLEPVTAPRVDRGGDGATGWGVHAWTSTEAMVPASLVVTRTHSTFASACYPIVEPSALDLRPAVTPLRVRKVDASRLRITWEYVGAPTYELLRGSIAALAAGSYDHDAFGHCDHAIQEALVADDPGSWYFLVASRSGDLLSPLGRDSQGHERPPSLTPCR